MKIALALLVLSASVSTARAADGPCASYLRPSYQRDFFLPQWKSRASVEAKKFMEKYAGSASPAAALEMQCLISVGLSRVVKNENDSQVTWERDHKNIRPWKGQDQLEAASAELLAFKKTHDFAHLSADDRSRLAAVQAKVRDAQAELGRIKGLCNEWTQSVCSAFTLPTRYTMVNWVEIRWEGRGDNEATHNMVALCPKEVVDPFQERDRCLLIDAWRNLDRDHDVYAFSEYKDMGVSRTRKTCPEGKTITTK